MTEPHPEKRLIGYARVSTYGQTLDAQLEQLRAAGCTSRNIYREKVTGARADRRELNRMLGKLAPGDVVTVTRIDRLAQHLRPLRHRQAHRGRQGAVSILGGTVGRQQQHRALDAGGTRRACRCSTRSYPHPHRRRQEPRQGPRKADGPTPFPQHRSRRKRPSGDARRALRCKNWRAATM
jgi:hypothetical protein